MDINRKQKLVDQIAASLAIEGMPLTVQEKERLVSCATGKRTTTDVLQELIARYTVK